jgi:mannosyltransferase
MSSSVALGRSRRDASARALARARRLAVRAAGWPLEVTVVAVLAVLAFELRRRALGASLWIDEGISVGIASHPLSEIPGLLRQDGSPPLFYILLHWWIGIFGSTESSTHAFTAASAILCVPAAWWAARPFGRAAGLAAAAILAVSPFVGLYADETRMYSLVLLLTLLATGAFLRAFVLRRRAYVAVFAALLAAVLYTHAWGAFYAASAGLAWLGLLAWGPDRRRVAIDGLLAFGGSLVLFAPWLPTLAYQTAHTGAPWSHRTTGRSLTRALQRMLGGVMPETILLLVAGGGLAEIVLRGPAAQRRAALAVVVVSASTLCTAWAWSHFNAPAWALRYLVTVLAPLVIAIAAGLGRLPVLGAATLVVVVLLAWQGKPSTTTLERKSNVSAVAAELAPALPRGTTVFSHQPEQVPNLRYYLPPGMRYLTPLGRVRDPGVMDWRDAMKRLRAARYKLVLLPAVRRLRPGARLLLVQPQFSHPDAPWTALIRRITRRWTRSLRRSGLVRTLRTIHPDRGSSRSTVSAILLERTTHAQAGRHPRHRA